MEVLNYPYSQGDCGSCYLVAAMGAAGPRMCHAGHDIKSKHLSTMDLLECTKDMNGEFCRGESDMKYGEGCDGGDPGTIYRFAVDHGLIEGDCHRYSIGGDPTKHMEPKPTCTIQSSTGKNPYCGNSYIDMSGRSGKVAVDKIFCTCDTNNRKNYEGLQIWYE